MRIFFIFTLLLFFVSCDEGQELNTQQGTSSMESSKEKSPKVTLAPKVPDVPDSLQQTQEKVSEEILAKVSEEQIIEKRNQEADSLLVDANNKQERANARIKEAENKEREAEALIKEAGNKERAAEALIKEAKELRNEARLEWLKEMAIYIILFLSIVAALFLSVFLQKIYTWRKKINGKAIILPEEVRDDIDKNHKNINLLLRKIGDLSNVSTQNNQLNNKYFNEINEALTPLKNTIASQRDEIKRLQKGYDNHIKKSFVRRLIDLRDRISFYTKKENKNSPEVIDATNNILKIVDYMFKTENIKTMTFESGLLLKDLDSDEVDILEENSVNTKDIKLAGTVKDTLSPCYYLEGNDGKKEIIKKGMITFYKK